MRTAALAIALSTLLAVGLAYGARGQLETSLSRPLEPGGPERLVVVPPGTQLPALMAIFEEADLIDASWTLDLWARSLNDATSLVPGEYRLGPGLSPVQLLERVESGRVYEHTITLAAGSTLEAMAEVLGSAQIVEPKAFLSAARSPEVARRLGVDGDSVEGFIFPDVWGLARGRPAEALVEQLVGRFFEEAPNLPRAARRLGLTVYQLVTLASLVERGPVPAGERHLYAALLLERLQKGYALESRAADEYGRTRPGAPADPREDPWNTTERPGLPRTPIGSPSLAALRSTSEPADTEPVFMVRIGSGRHVFCPNETCYRRALAEHAPGRQPALPKRFGDGP